MDKEWEGRKGKESGRSRKGDVEEGERGRRNGDSVGVSAIA